MGHCTCKSEQTTAAEVRTAAPSVQQKRTIMRRFGPGRKTVIANAIPVINSGDRLESKVLDTFSSVENN
jgi:hypothetical protein